MVDMSDKALKVLMSAKLQKFGDGELMFVNRTLGYQTWKTRGAKGRRADIAELYRLGLIEEFADPLGPPCNLTAAGVCEYMARTNAS